jgi:hypothetical protein
MKTLLVVALLSAGGFAQNLLETVPHYRPITGKQRFEWFVSNTVGPTSLFAVGPASAAWGTAFNSPKEYGPHWDGFGKRYGMRLTGVSVGNAMEAGLGAIWGEDPRYFRLGDGGFKSRVKYVVLASFMAPAPDGRWRPAYARYAGNIGNNFSSNTWRVPSESTAGQATVRCVYGVLGELGGNAFTEFWPDIRKKIFRKWRHSPN